MNCKLKGYILFFLLVIFIPLFSQTVLALTKGVYRINQAKDSNGNLLTSVKIYVDDVYTHHEDNEILTFCDNCYCDNDHTVSCNFGEHKISLEKNGYLNWMETKTINAGDSFETNPILVVFTPTPTLTPTIMPVFTETPTPSLTSTPTQVSPTGTLSPTKSTYKINKAKDENGGTLSSVKIYVDNVYIHHEDDEILTFCDGCHCDENKIVDCGFGEHTIKLQKDGFADWSEIKTLNSGNNIDVNPIMSKINPTSTSVPTPTLTLVPTLTPKPTVTPKLSITPKPTLVGKSLLATASAEEVLGTDSSKLLIAEANDKEVVFDENKEIKKDNSPNKLFLIPIAIGVCFLGFAVFQVIKNKVK